MKDLKEGLLQWVYDTCVRHFLEGIDPQLHAAAYGSEHDSGFAESEFAGKYLDICAQFYRHTKDERILKNAKVVVEQIVSTQRADGYLGGYQKGHEWDNFSVWNQAFTDYGLVSYWKITGDERALAAAEKSVCYIAEHFMKDGYDILDADNYGTQHASILIALPGLYQATGKSIYLDFAKHIIERLCNSDNNFMEFDSILNLRSKKGIENFVILIGLILYGEVTGDKSVLTGCKKYWEEVAKTQIRETGNGTVEELWTEDGNQPGFLPLELRPNENCVAVGWCELSVLLFRADVQTKYLDEIEKSLFNHLLGSLDEACEDFAYYQPNFGRRITRTSESAYKCCRYRGYSAISFLPEVLFYENNDCVIPMIYANSVYEKGTVRIIEKTSYPFGDTVEFEVTGKVALKLRIPGWCERYTITVNGREIKTAVSNGFVELAGVWEKDCIRLCFHTEVKAKEVIIDGESYLGLTYGAVLLALDSSFGNDVFHTMLDAQAVYTSVSDTNYHIEFAVTGYENGVRKEIHVVDYASAGKKAPEDEYTVWVKSRRKEYGVF